jgi:hypothetical protein
MVSHPKRWRDGLSAAAHDDDVVGAEQRSLNKQEELEDIVQERASR